MPSRIPFPVSIFALSAALAIASSPAFVDAAEAEKGESWQVIYLGGQRIGYSHSLIESFERDGKSLIRTSSTTSMTFKRIGDKLVMKQILTTEETLDGQLLKFHFELSNPPARSTSTIGKIDGETLNLEQLVNGEVKLSSMPWRQDVKSPTFQDRALKESPLKPGENRSFEAFMPEFNKFATIKLVATEPEETSLLTGKPRRLMKVKMSQSIIPGLVVNEFIDDQGEMLKSTTSMLGLEMATYQVSREEALKAISGEELDLAVSTLIKVKNLTKPHDATSIKYRITTTGQDPAAMLPTSETQAVKKVSDEVAEVTVTALPLPEKAQAGHVAAEFLASSQYLQTDDARVKEHATKAVGNATDAAEMARRMEKYVNTNLTNKNFSTAIASAAEVADTMSGDCTEHAVLLAAMLRAKGIPSRVVIGLVYVERLGAFGGHMWTEANLNDHWIPLDATIGRGGIGCGHLRLHDSSLADDGPSAISNFAPLMLVGGKLQIEVAE